jgi:hypothetical protein
MHLYIYNALVHYTMKCTELLSRLEPLQRKISVNFNSGGLHFYFVDKIGIGAFLRIFAPRHTNKCGTLI